MGSSFNNPNINMQQNEYIQQEDNHMYLDELNYPEQNIEFSKSYYGELIRIYTNVNIIILTFVTNDSKTIKITISSSDTSECSALYGMDKNLFDEPEPGNIIIDHCSDCDEILIRKFINGQGDITFLKNQDQSTQMELFYIQIHYTNADEQEHDFLTCKEV